MNIDDLLTRLGWPTGDLDKKGMLQWHSEEINALVVVVPKEIRVTLSKNAIDLETPAETYYQAIWDITSGQPKRVVHVSCGDDMTSTQSDEQAIKGFTSLVAAFRRSPQFTIMGKRVKG